jgi:hypothetical protein
MKVPRSARKELTDNPRLTEELRLALVALVEVAPDSETQEEAIDFLINLTNIERINQLKWLISEEHHAEVQKQFQQGVIQTDKWENENQSRYRRHPRSHKLKRSRKGQHD